MVRLTAAARIKELVNSKGVSYTFISDKTGIPVDAISRTFLGKRRLMADEMIDFCSAVGIDLQDILSIDTDLAANQ